MCGRYAVGNCISNYKKSFQHYLEYYEGCTIEEADETDEDEEIENQTENASYQNLLCSKIWSQKREKKRRLCAQ